MGTKYNINKEEFISNGNKLLTAKATAEYMNIPLYTVHYYAKKFNYVFPMDSHAKNEIGNKYGKFIVESFAGRTARGEILWNCRCKCGNIEQRTGVIFRYTSKNSECQCKECQKKFIGNIHSKEWIGKKQGRLTILERIGQTPQGNILYKCKCDCGNIINVSTSNLVAGQISCGCLVSKGEEKINNILSENNITYITQKQFENCRYKLPLKFDFAIYDNNNLLCLIEFQGEQHYKYNNNGWNTEEHFIKLQKRDNIKRQWCKNNNIKLIEIPYYDYEKLNSEYLLSKIYN